MAIKRRYSRSPLRKELDLLIELPFGEAKNILIREGKFEDDYNSQITKLLSDMDDIIDEAEGGGRDQKGRIKGIKMPQLMELKELAGKLANVAYAIDHDLDDIRYQFSLDD